MLNHRVRESENQRIYPSDQCNPAKVLTQGFSMVSGENDKSIIGQMALFQMVEQPAQNVIRVGHFSIIRRIFKPAEEWFRRFIGVVGIKKMDPDKPW